MNQELINIITEYVCKYLIKLIQEQRPFEYYWMNKNYPECVIDNMSDEEIACKYPLSAERLILDCWAAATEHTKLEKEDWVLFVLFINEYVVDCIKCIENEKR